MTARDAFNKDMVISGCPVRLDFQQTDSCEWTVAGTVECGVGENRRQTTFQTASFRTSEEAESAALRKASDLIGKNMPT
jgi:hypothetical protein